MQSCGLTQRDQTAYVYRNERFTSKLALLPSGGPPTLPPLGDAPFATPHSRFQIFLHTVDTSHLPKHRLLDFIHNMTMEEGPEEARRSKRAAEREKYHRFMARVHAGDSDAVEAYERRKERHRRNTKARKAIVAAALAAVATQKHGGKDEGTAGVQVASSPGVASKRQVSQPHGSDAPTGLNDSANRDKCKEADIDDEDDMPLAKRQKLVGGPLAGRVHALTHASEKVNDSSEDEITVMYYGPKVNTSQPTSKTPSKPAKPGGTNVRQEKPSAGQAAPSRGVRQAKRDGGEQQCTQIRTDPARASTTSKAAEPIKANSSPPVSPPENTSVARPPQAKPAATTKPPTTAQQKEDKQVSKDEEELELQLKQIDLQLRLHRLRKGRACSE